MDCSNARLLLAFARPRANELPHPEAAELRHHLDSCAECAAVATAERRADDHLGRAVRDVPMPTGLKGRLLERLKSQHGPTRRRWVAGIASAVGVAAALLLGVGLWAIVSGGWPTPVDAGELQGFIAIKTSNPTPEIVEDVFRGHYGVHMIAPRSFGQEQLDYSLLLDYDLVTLPSGRTAPKLLFVRGNNRLVVYVLAKQQFKTIDGPEEESQGWTGRVVRNANDQFDYILLFKGGKLDVFFQPQPPAL